MSYLDAPRIHFAGRFIAKPSTVNNEAENYGRTTAEIEAVWKVTGQNHLGWNPDGNHQWQLDGCTVQSIVGATYANPNDLAGATVESTNQLSNAKLVDLDPQQQMVSQIWGLGIRLATADGDSFEGTFDVVPFNDLTQRSRDGSGFGVLGAYYQSALRNVQWSGTLRSPLLRSLRRRSPDTLSIKFMVDSYQPDSGQPNFTFGRIVGTIGPQLSGQREPNNFVPGRLLRPVPQPPDPPPPAPPLEPAYRLFNYAPVRVDGVRHRVSVDLGNSLPFTEPNGPYANIGPLQLALLPAGQRPRLLGPVGNVPYEENAGIYEIAVSNEELALVSNTPLGVVRASTGGTHRVLLAENSIGAYLDATQYVFRLNPGQRTKLSLDAYAFGAPKANQIIRLRGRTFTGGQITGNPPPLSFPATVTTNARGGISVTLEAGDPGSPRNPIDGQVYRIEFIWDGVPTNDYKPDPNRCLSVRVFSGFTVPTRPTWAEIQPILDQYGRLYPSMRNLINLSDAAAVQQALERISAVLSLPQTDPGYMPVTRDLSENKRKAILRWIRNGAPQ